MSVGPVWHCQSLAVRVTDVRNTVVIVGVIITLAGLLFSLQGFGAVSGSSMTNTSTWSVLGPIIALVGVVIVFAGRRGLKR